MNSILTSIKKLLGIAEEYEHFDSDIIAYVNSTFATLNQLGVGPATGFFISDSTSKWSDFVLSEMIQNLSLSYIHLKVKLLFDPPASSTVMEAIKKSADELEWRILFEIEKVTG
ncbi:MAG: hypothetical protein K9L62_02165 [Vallitaleaceae bacterium]|nr:hypothetical protein [Vallitaleaceae bacterium]